ncbi:hypothetical protein [Rubinisphaera sp.]|nr:hypothetical protein [Rubinisphaera sp.]|tara:strand:- start:345 stop:494 length:150 start_codon:yes stop_codon:yes gene_type:complete
MVNSVGQASSLPFLMDASEIFAGECMLALLRDASMAPIFQLNIIIIAVS